MALKFNLLNAISIDSILQNTLSACEYSEDGRISIVTDAGVYVLSLKGYMGSPFPRLSFSIEIATLSNTAISDYVDVDLKSFAFKLPRHQLYKAVLDVAISGNGFLTEELSAKPTYAKWSPRGIVEKTDCLLAVLTNLHNIEFYVKEQDEHGIVQYNCVGNFAKDIAEHYRTSWKDISELSAEDSLEELMRRIDYITPTTFVWSHAVLSDGSVCCVLFVGHRDGSVSAWRLHERKSNDCHETKLEFLERYSTRIGHITAMHWLCRSSDEGGLTIGDSDGRVCAISVSELSTDAIKFSDEVSFCTDTDLKVDKITVMTSNKNTYIAVVKFNSLMVYGIDESGELFGGRVVQGINLFVSGIYPYEKNILLVLDSSGQLILIELNKAEENQLLLTERPIDIGHLSTGNYITHGLLMSPNKVFMGIVAYPSNAAYDGRLSSGTIEFFLYENCDKNPFQMLMDAEIDSLRDHWDCLETLRVSCLRKAKFPWEGIDPRLNYDTLPLHKLKILRWVAKISECVYELVPRIVGYSIKSFTLLSSVLDIKLAILRMNKLLQIYFSEKKLTLFQMQSLDLLNSFLKEMVTTDVLRKANLGSTFIDEICEVMEVAKELSYPPPPQCVWCGEKLMGSSCVPCHPDTRCALSLMPIKTITGYRCPFCKCVLSSEIGQEYQPIFCPYCDVPMEHRYVDRCNAPKKRHMEARTPVTPNTVITGLADVVSSDCYGDCLEEQHRASDVEENRVDYVVFTDSEDEKESLVMKETFARIKSTVLTPLEEETPKKDEPEFDLDEFLLNVIEDETSDKENDSEISTAPNNTTNLGDMHDDEEYLEELEEDDDEVSEN